MRAYVGLAIAVGGMAFIAASWLARQSLAVCLLAVLAAVAAAPDLSFRGLHIVGHLGSAELLFSVE